MKTRTYILLGAVATATIISLTLLIRQYLGFWLSLFIGVLLGISMLFYYGTNPQAQAIKTTFIEKLAKKKLLILTIALALIAIAGIGEAIRRYWQTFHASGVSDNPANWGVFGDYFGGILNPFLSLLTLIVTIVIASYLKKADDFKNEQTISASYQPQIVIDQSVFYTYPSDKFSNRKVVGFSKLPAPNLITLRSPNPFGIDIYNIGLGAAKNITLQYEIDTNQILHAIAAMSVVRPPQERVTVTRTAHPPYPDVLEFHYPANLSPTIKVESDSINTDQLTHLLNVSVSNKPYEYFFPRYLLELYTIFQYYWMEQMQQDANNLPHFPPFLVHITFHDINNKSFPRKTFRIKLESLQGGLSEFMNKITVNEIN